MGAIFSLFFMAISLTIRLMFMTIRLMILGTVMIVNLIGRLINDMSASRRTRR